QAPGHGQLSAGRGGEQVRLVAAPGELTLFLSGRQRVARVQLDGPRELVQRLRGASLGI
ncbi:TIGR03085 family protein, partial [Micromonospora azadirachtae]